MWSWNHFYYQKHIVISGLFSSGMALFHHAKDYYLEYCPPNFMMPYVTSLGTMCQLNVPLETTIIKSKEPDHPWFRNRLLTCSVSNHLPKPDLMKNVILCFFQNQNWIMSNNSLKRHSRKFMLTAYQCYNNIIKCDLYDGFKQNDVIPLLTHYGVTFLSH